MRNPYEENTVKPLHAMLNHYTSLLTFITVLSKESLCRRTHATDKRSLNSSQVRES